LHLQTRFAIFALVDGMQMHRATGVSHWPIWLRLLALVAVILFIRMVGGMVRHGESKPPDKGEL
jgi:uncharacterized membrane protein YhdT